MTGMKWRLIYITLLLLLPVAVSAQSGGVRRRSHKDVETEGTVSKRMQELNERAHSRLSGGMSLSPQQYEDTIRALFKQDRWHDAEPLLVSAEREWEGRSVICYLIGRYWYHEENVDLARRYLLLAMLDDESNTEALELLVRLEENEHNYATAIVHVNDLLEFSPYNIGLWRKKIDLYRMLGNNKEANRLLERLSEIYPDDEQIRKDIIYQKEQEYVQLSKQGNERESQQAIEELISRNPKDVQYYLDLSGSLLKEGKTDEAIAVCAKGVFNTHGNRNLIRRRVSILSDCARYQEAEQYLDECIRNYGSTGLTDLRAYLREQAAYAADQADAYTRHERIYATTGSEDALNWLVSNAMQRGWWDDAQYYLHEQQQRYGKTKSVLSKQFLVEKRLGNERTASRILEELYQVDRNDADIREQLAEKRLKEGVGLMQEEMWKEALVPLRQADSLTTDADMHEVLARRIRTCEALLPDTTVKDSLDQLQHSMLYEKAHNLDSAYACLMRYRPSLDEFHEVQRHRYTLQSKLMKNSLSFEYQLVRRTSTDAWNNNARATYSRSFKHDAFDVMAGYAGRETSAWKEELSETKDTTYTTAGGSGFEVGGMYYHYFEWGDLSAGGSWASKFFPKATAKVSVTENLPQSWTLSERLQWRYIADETKYHVFSAGLSAAWSSENGFVLTPALDAFLMQRHVYLNGGFKMMYLPLDGDRSNVFVSVGAGNAPDLSLMDSNMPLVFNMLNTNMSAGGFYLINGHFGLSGSVDWYLMGDNKNTIRNYIYLHLGMSIFF